MRPVLDSAAIAVANSGAGCRMWNAAPVAGRPGNTPLGSARRVEMMSDMDGALLGCIVATCKLNGVDPVAYLAAILRAILDGILRTDEDLMPWRFQIGSSVTLNITWDTPPPAHPPNSTIALGRAR
jgi:IS66 C-terminal element